MAKRRELTFEAGFPRIEYTQVPDKVLDNLNAFSDAELRVVLYVVRHTLGWQKESDRISLTQMVEGVQRRDGTNVDWGTGLSRTAIRNAVKSLERRGALIVEREEIKPAREGKKAGRAVNRYRLNVAGGVGHTVPQGRARGAPTRNSRTRDKGEDESLSLALEISEAHGNGARDRKALTTSLSKYPVTVLEKVGEQLDQRIAAGEVENPAAYANRLAQVFAEAAAEAQTIREAQEQQTFDTILSTAVFENTDGQTPADLRESLLEYWPGEEALIQRAVELVST